jgi:ABC-type sugar transport system permease subunit/ABC-type glycerol-3-phosphate transport system substrate-binding protein
MPRHPTAWRALLLALPLLICSRPALARETITVWAMGEEGKKIRAMADLFERANPDVAVRTQAIPWDAAEAKLLTAVVGEITPDVVQLGTTYVPKFAAMDALLPLDERLDRSAAVRRADFFPGPLQTATYEGRLYGVPWYIDTWVLYYRSDLLREAGLPGPPRTWEELRAAGRRLRRPDRYGIALSPSDGATLAVFAAQAGAPILAGARLGVRDARFLEAVRFYVSLFDDKIAPRGETRDVNLYQAFERGLYPMMIGGPWMLTLIDKECPKIRGRWSVATLPRGRRESSFVGGSVLSVFRRSRRPDLAWRFIEYLSRTPSQVRWYELSTTLPPTRSAWASDALRRDPRVAVFGEQLRSAEAPPAVPEWEELRDKIGRDYLEKFVYHAKDPALSMVSLEAELRAILAKRHRAQTQSPALKLGLLGLVALLILGGIGVMLARRSRGKPDAGGLDVRDVRSARHVPYLFLLPGLAILFVFLFLPIIASFLISLTDWNIYALSDWKRITITGLANYRALMWELHGSELDAVTSWWGYLAFWNYLGDPVFWRALFNTFAFVVLGVPLSIATSLLAAIGLNQAFLRGKTLFRVAYFMPVVTTMVAVAVVWRWLYNPKLGLINYLLEQIGVPGQEWLSSPRLALPALILMAVWKNFGYNMIIFIAGLQAIPEMYYEAAKIDGAGTLQRFRHVTLPLLSPTLYFVSIMTVIGYFQFFAEPYVMTGGGPLNSTMSIVLYMYNHGFKFYNLGYASAIAFILFAFISLFTLGQSRLSRRIGTA